MENTGTKVKKEEDKVNLPKIRIEENEKSYNIKEKADKK